MDDNKWYLDLSDEDLAKELGLSVQTVKKYNKSLIAKGILKIVEKDGKEVKELNLNYND